MLPERVGCFQPRESRKINTGNDDVRADSLDGIDLGQSIFDAANHFDNVIQEVADKISRRFGGVSDENTKSTSHISFLDLPCYSRGYSVCLA